MLRALGQLGVTNAAELQPILGSLATAVPIKKLLLVLEMAMTADRRVDPARFTETLQHAGILG